MKNEIMSLLSSPDGELRINPVCKLRRFVDIDSKKNIDKLFLDFDAFAGMEQFAHSVEITGRNYEAILADILMAITDYFSQITRWLNGCLINGCKC